MSGREEGPKAGRSMDPSAGARRGQYYRRSLPCNLGDRPQSIHDPAVTGCIQGKQKSICFPFFD